MESDFAGQEAVVTGWGTTASGGDLSEVLREVTVGVISNQVLRGTFNLTVVGKEILVKQRHFSGLGYLALQCSLPNL